MQFSHLWQKPGFKEANGGYNLSCLILGEVPLPPHVLYTAYMQGLIHLAARKPRTKTEADVLAPWWAIELTRVWVNWVINTGADWPHAFDNH